MSDVDLSAAVEAGARAMFCEEQCDRMQALDVEANWNARLGGKDRNEYRSLARAALDVAAPLIEAQVRAQAAAEIEAAVEDHISSLGPVFDDSFIAACGFAARIARGESS